MSSHWVQALPQTGLKLTGSEFSEAMASTLCIPSPACSSKLGEAIGKRWVDLLVIMLSQREPREMGGERDMMP